MKFVKATKTQARLRMALVGPAGSGKTYSALALATKLVPGGRVALIDTERGSASKYADTFEFDTLDLDIHDPDNYVEAIQAAEAGGYDVVVIDSLSHAWNGRGGALEQVDLASARDPRGNSFTAWRNITPKHNRLVDAVVGCKCHVIATIRAKTEFVQEKDERGKTVIRKVGLAPVQRDGLEYEFDVVGDMQLEHNRLVVSKTRCSALADAVIDKPGEKLANTLRAWLTDGAAPVAKVAPAPAPTRPAQDATPSISVASALKATSLQFIEKIRAATTREDLNQLTADPDKPKKGTEEYTLALAEFEKRRSAIDAQAVAA